MRRILLTAAAVLALAAPAEARTHHHAGPVHHALSGTATFYGGPDGLCGHRVATGGRFDCHAMTAAHRTLPFGTILDVRDPTTGRHVTVEINDRGPYTGAFIDLSPAAAERLGGRRTHYGLVAEIVRMGDGSVAGSTAARAEKIRAVSPGEPVQLASAFGFAPTEVAEPKPKHRRHKN